MRYLTALAVSAVTALMLAGCGSSPPGPAPLGPPPSSQQPAPPPPATSPQQSSNDAVTGTVTWPDGNPAANASVYFYDHEPQFNAMTDGWSDGQYSVQRLPADGSYSLAGCPCQDLTAYLYVPGTPGADPGNGGRDCWIIMQDDNGTYAGRQASPGDVINWQALDLPCSPLWYVSDPSVVQSQSTTLDPSQNGGDYSVYAGTWHAAEQRTSGGVSGG